MNTRTPLFRASMLWGCHRRKELTLSLLKLDALFLNDYSMEKTMPKWIIQTSQPLSFLTRYWNRWPNGGRSPANLWKENIKVYTSQFASMYTAVTQHRQQAKFKLITAGPKKGSLAFMVLATESMK